MARAMLRRRPILVMDEATASVDHVTDTHIQQMVKRDFKGNCTVITIAHRCTRWPSMTVFCSSGAARCRSLTRRFGYSQLQIAASASWRRSQETLRASCRRRRRLGSERDMYLTVEVMVETWVFAPTAVP